MARVVYNACYGGFGLSDAAILKGREISGDPKWGGAAFAGETYTDGSVLTRNFGSHHGDVSRTDHVLLSVIDAIGLEASSAPMARLKIAYVPSGGRYRIDEYDGNETVKTPDDYEWAIAGVRDNCTTEDLVTPPNDGGC